MGRGDKKQGGGLLAKGVTGLVGLATEVHKYQKDKKAATAENTAQQPERSFPNPNSQRLPPPPPAGHLSDADDERLHELDDLSHEIGDEPPTYDDVVPSSSMAKSFNVDKKALSAPVHGVRPLPYPIILPQRRPGSKGRGFIQAYPPSIGEYKGIDQDQFLGFLKEFHQQSQASHIFEVIIVGAEGAKWAPSAIAMVVGTGVQIGAVGARELHSRSRTNDYLTKINEDLFHPVNLHALIMVFDPDVSGTKVANIDTSSGLAAPALNTQGMGSSLSPPSSSSPQTSRLSGRFKIADGTTRSEAEMIHAAPLIFPSIDRAMMFDPDKPGSQDNKMKRAGRFLSDYMDRRAQATYAAQHGADSALAVPGAMDSSRFASRFSNPNDPTSKGGLKALLPIGGGRPSMDGSSHRSDDRSDSDDHDRRSHHHHDKKHDHDNQKRDREDRRHNHGGGGRRSLEQTYHDRGQEDYYYSSDRSMARQEQHQHRDRHSSSARGDQSPSTGQKTGLMGGFSKFLKPGVLYLLIAEIPTQAQMQDMRA